MRRAGNKHPFLVLQNTTLCILAILFFSLSGYSQTDSLHQDINSTKLNPIFLAALKKPWRPNPLLAERIKPTKYELMYWPSYYLAQEQITARDKQRRRSVGENIAGDIIKNYANTILYGKKMAPAVIPNF